MLAPDHSYCANMKLIFKLEEWIVEICHIHAARTAFISRWGRIISFSLKQLTILVFFSTHKNLHCS